MMAFSFNTKFAAMQDSISSGLSTLPLWPYPSGIINKEHKNHNVDLFNLQQHHHPKTIIHPPIQIDLTDEEEDLFDLLRTVTADRGMKTTLRVAGGWVRDKILASHDFQSNKQGNSKYKTITHQNEKSPHLLTTTATTKKKANSKEEDLELTFQAILKSSFTPSLNSDSGIAPVSFSVTENVDIDITLDDCLGSEFATELDTWLSDHPNYSVGCILSNPEQTQHLETATMRLNNYWIDFVNLRAEEYNSHPSKDSRIPDVMRIGTPLEDAQRRDLTINSLFYNINTRQIEDFTGRGIHDLQRGVVDTPLTPLKTLLDDPLRVMRTVRFAARLHFDISDTLWHAASHPSVNVALGRKVSRERIGSEVNLMLQSRHPARALELLVNLDLIKAVFPKPKTKNKELLQQRGVYTGVYKEGLSLLTTTHDHLVDCMTNRPGWCEAKRALESGAVNGLSKEETLPLMEDEEARRLLWYAAFLKPLRDRTFDEEEHDVDRKRSRKAKGRTVIQKLLVDDLKRPTKEAESIEAIMMAADEFTDLISTGGSESALAILLSGARVVVNKKEQLGLEVGEDRSMKKRIKCTMSNSPVDPNTEDDPLWEHAMEFRQRCAKVLKKGNLGLLWRAAFILSLSEQLLDWQTYRIDDEDDDAEDHLCEGPLKEEGGWSQETPEQVICSILKKYDVFAAAMLQLGLIGIWKQKPILDGGEIKGGSDPILPNLPNGPEFRTIMDSQIQWMITHPGGSREALVEHLREEFRSYA